MSRLDRALVVRRQILELATEHGRWEEVAPGADGGRCLRVIDAGLGWSALISTSREHTEELLVLGRHGATPPQTSSALNDLLIDLYDDASGIKVLSLRQRGGEDRIVNYTRGPWEAAFGLAPREWPPSVAERVEGRREVVA